MKDKLINSEKFYSQRKFKMYQNCAREFFLHYYAAYGEYDYNVSDIENFHVHLLKQLKREDEFLQYLVAQSLNELFLLHVNIGELAKIMLNTGSKLFNKMLLAEFEKDHKYPVLYDYYYKSGKNFDEIFDGVTAKIKKISNFLMDNSILQKLFYCDKLNFYQLEDGIAFAELGIVRIYADILFGVELEGKYYFVSFDREDRDFIRFFHLYYGVNKKHMRPDLIKSVLIDINNLTVTEMDNYNVDITGNIEQICRNYAAIPTFDLSCDYNYIEKTLDKSKCENCRFKELCI